jgi:hypothetical protein
MAWQKSHDAAAYTLQTGNVMIQSVAYGALSDGDWGMVAIPLCAKICIGQPPTSKLLSSSSSNLGKLADVTQWVRTHIADRDQFKNRVGFRLHFEKECSGVCPDIRAEFYAGESATPPYLSVKVLYP